MKKVSIIIPIYNSQKTLKQCLGAVLSQTYDNYEVIAVDNNSNDQSKNIIQSMMADNEKLKYVFYRHRSRGGARNAGLQTATGEIIATTDSDCVVPSCWLEKIVQPIISEGEMAVIGGEDDGIGNYWSRHACRANNIFATSKAHGKYISHLDTKNFAIKSTTLKDLGFDTSLGALEDFDLYLRLKDRGLIRFLPELKVRHFHRGSLVETINTNFTRAFWSVAIAKKYQDHKKETMLQFTKNNNLIRIIVHGFGQIKRMPLDSIPFYLILSLSWLFGLTIGKLFIRS